MSFSCTINETSLQKLKPKKAWCSVEKEVKQRHCKNINLPWESICWACENGGLAMPWDDVNIPGDGPVVPLDDATEVTPGTDAGGILGGPVTCGGLNAPWPKGGCPGNWGLTFCDGPLCLYCDPGGGGNPGLTDWLLVVWFPGNVWPWLGPFIKTPPAPGKGGLMPAIWPFICIPPWEECGALMPFTLDGGGKTCWPWKLDTGTGPFKTFGPDLSCMFSGTGCLLPTNGAPEIENNVTETNVTCKN